MKTIYCTNGQPMLVDDRDFARLSRHLWTAKKAAFIGGEGTTYAETSVRIRKGKWTSITATRMIFKLTPGDGIAIDHKDGNGLNNQRNNRLSGKNG